MNKNVFLTSALVMGMVVPVAARADIAPNSASATCIADTIGVSSGNTALEAIWYPNSSTCDAGTYLNALTANCTTCPADSYCVGGTYTYNGSDLGITDACPTNYYSDEGASAQTDCYRACTTDDVLHSTSVSGRYYYGDNNQCAPTNCAKGWHVFDINLVNLDDNATNSVAIWGEGNGNFQEKVYSDKGGTAHEQSYYGISNKGEWAVKFNSFGTVRGNGICSTVYNEEPIAQILDETGQDNAKYCYCNITGLKINDRSDWTMLSSSHVFVSNMNDSANMCASECSAKCASTIAEASYFRNNIFATISNSLATCTTNTYTCPAGTYLDNSTETCIECPAGSYCTGGEFIYNGSDQGITGTCPSEYVLSNIGAKSINECYRSCTTDDITRSAAVSGKYYYGDVNMCQATSCASGWTSKEGVNLNGSFSVNNPSNSTWVSINANGVYNYNNANGGNGTIYEKSYYGITEDNSWAVNFDSWKTIKGTAVCSTTTGSYQELSSEVNMETGNNCWCKITGFRNADEVDWKNLSSEWAFGTTTTEGPWNNYNATTECSNYCAKICSYFIATNMSSFRYTLFTSIPNSSCTPNTLNIDWYDGDNVVEQNTCTYSETITLPAEPTRAGYSFGGWQLVQDND